MRVADICRETDLPRSTATALYRETAQRIELDVIARLCSLFDCEVGICST